jgi:hypothetical protein
MQPMSSPSSWLVVLGKVAVRMTGENVCLADPIVGEKSIGRFGVGPILASQWNAFSHGTSDLAQQLPESPAEPRIPKFAPADFPINPVMAAGLRLGSGPPGPVPQYQPHGAPRHESGAQQ